MDRWAWGPGEVPPRPTDPSFLRPLPAHLPRNSGSMPGSIASPQSRTPGVINPWWIFRNPFFGGTFGGNTHLIARAYWIHPGSASVKLCGKKQTRKTKAKGLRTARNPVLGKLVGGLMIFPPERIRPGGFREPWWPLFRLQSRAKKK